MASLNYFMLMSSALCCRQTPTFDESFNFQQFRDAGGHVGSRERQKKNGANNNGRGHMNNHMQMTTYLRRVFAA